MSADFTTEHYLGYAHADHVAVFDRDGNSVGLLTPGLVAELQSIAGRWQQQAPPPAPVRTPGMTMTVTVHAPVGTVFSRDAFAGQTGEPLDIGGEPLPLGYHPPLTAGTLLSAVVAADGRSAELTVSAEAETPALDVLAGRPA